MRTPRLHSLRWRLAAGFGLVLLAIGIGGRYIHYRLTVELLSRDLDAQLWARLGTLKAERSLAPESLSSETLKVGDRALAGIRQSSDRRPSLLLWLFMPAEAHSGLAELDFAWVASVWDADGRLVASADPEAALEAANTLLDLLNSERLSHDGAAEWTRRGLDVLEKNREVGRGYFRMGSKYSLDVLEELREGLALRQVARVLKLYATALSGRDVAVRGIDEMETVDRFGPDHIILPADMRFFQDDDRNFTAYKVAAAHGAARIEFGTYRFQLDDVPETVEALTERYGNSVA
jgi:hypothetical protein